VKTREHCARPAVQRRHLASGEQLTYCREHWLRVRPGRRNQLGWSTSGVSDASLSCIAARAETPDVGEPRRVPEARPK